MKDGILFSNKRLQQGIWSILDSIKKTIYDYKTL